MNPTKIINRIDGQWTTCSFQEYNPNDKSNFMFYTNNDTNTTTYLKKISQ